MLLVYYVLGLGIAEYSLAVGYFEVVRCVNVGCMVKLCKYDIRTMCKDVSIAKWVLQASYKQSMHNLKLNH